ncbi:MAG: hypothetical protein ABIR32_04385 [Ilumatobacteraceae bacterium]
MRHNHDTVGDDSRGSSGTTAIPHREFLSAAPAAAWAFAFLVLRIFAVSSYDWDTAFKVSATLGIDDGLALLFGSFMAGHLVVSIVIVFVLPLLVGTYLWDPDGHRPMVILPATVASITLIALTVSFRGWWLPVATLAVFALVALARRQRPGNRARRFVSGVASRVGTLAAFAGLLIAMLIPTPWVPRERIETTDGVVVGYVLSVDPGYLNVLTVDRKFVILISSNVLSRD